MAPSSQNDGADLMVQKLYDQGVISQNVFSFQVGTVDGTSHVTIGGYDVEEFSIEKELTWHNLINNFWWTLGLKGVQVGGKDIGVTTKQVIIDTGTSYALMPSCKNKIVLEMILFSRFQKDTAILHQRGSSMHLRQHFLQSIRVSVLR